MNGSKVDFFNKCVLFTVIAVAYGSCEVKTVGNKEAGKSSINEIPFEHVIIDENGPGDIWGKAVGDINGDKKIDLLAGGWKDGGLVWYENPSWEKHIISPEKGFSTDHEIYDMDGDGDNDVVSLIHPGSADSDATLVWYENPGWTRHVIEEKQAFHDIEIADFNGDGLPDIVLSPAELAGEYYRISWFEAPEDPTGKWKEHAVEPYTEAVHHFVGLADMNNNGETDIITAQMMQSKNPPEVSIYHNLGKGEAWEKQVIFTEGSHSIRLVDIDGDGDMDLYGANWRGDDRVHLWINQTIKP